MKKRLDVHLATGIFGFWLGKKAENGVYIIFDVWIRGIICLFVLPN